LFVPALPKSRRWTLADLTRLSLMAREGATAQQIAAALDRTVEAVRIKAAHQRIVLVFGGRQRPRVAAPPTVERPQADE
jgi:hypothetical protein